MKLRKMEASLRNKSGGKSEMNMVWKKPWNVSERTRWLPWNI